MTEAVDLLGSELRKAIALSNWEWDAEKIEAAIRHGEATAAIVLEHIQRFEKENPRGWGPNATAKARR